MSSSSIRKLRSFADLKGTEDRGELLRLGDRYLGAPDGGAFQAQPAVKMFSSSPPAAAPAGWPSWSPGWSTPRWWRRRRIALAEARGFKSLVRTRDMLLFPVNGVGLHEQKLQEQSRRSEARAAGAC